MDFFFEIEFIVTAILIYFANFSIAAGRHGNF